MDWLIRERVAFARELLETTDRPLHWVAEQAGFGSQESFRRHFRGQTELSSTTYREQHRGATNSYALTGC